jgi:hypothetical protein
MKKRFTTCWPSNGTANVVTSIAARRSGAPSTPLMCRCKRPLLIACTVEGGPRSSGHRCTVKGEPPSSGHRESSTHQERALRAIRSSSIRQQCVSADLLLRKDTTWTTRTCFPIPTHRNMSLREMPTENRSNTRRFRIGPTPTLPCLHRNDRERLYGRPTPRSSGADHFGPRPGRRHRRCMVAALSLSGR